MLNEQNLSAGKAHPTPAAEQRPPSGVLPVDKPAGMSSFSVVSRVKLLLPRGTKIGHAGTLDPFATGLLLLLIGKATRQCEAMMDQGKTYETTVRLGATTDTDDLTAREKPWRDPIVPSQAAIESALTSMTGPILQRPPVYSALKIGGRRACDRVRNGEIVKLQPRLVQVYRIDLLRYEWPDLRLRINCGRGTYIRAIARDLGETLGVGGYLTQLRRTKIGPFHVEDALALNNLDELPLSLYNDLPSIAGD